MNKLKHVVFIINPISGVDEPILAPIARAMKKYKVTWEIFISKSKDDIHEYAEQAVKLKPDAIAVYGGDGTILQVAGHVLTADIPLIILPGGTANILAKELKVPVNLPKSLELFGRHPKIRQVDISTCEDGTPMFLRIEVGLLADIVSGVKRKSKQTAGIFAYPVSAMQQLPNAKPVTYTLSLDGGKSRKVTGVGLMIANVGNIGLSGVSIQKSVVPTDGKLDVFVFQATDIGTILSIGTSSLVGSKRPPTMRHWKVKKVDVTITPRQTVLRDDVMIKTNSLSVHIDERKLKILV